MTWAKLRAWWSRLGLEPGDPDTPEWHEYRRECRRIQARNRGPGGYQGMPLPPGFKPPPVPRGLRKKFANDSDKYPITPDEVMEVLEKIPEVSPPGMPQKIGGVEDLIRRGILTYFKKPENMDLLLKEQFHG